MSTAEPILLYHFRSTMLLILSKIRFIFNVIMEKAHSGQHGDGKVYVMDVIKGGRVRTAEQDPDLG